ncbi:hypothetical protein ACET3Z_005055 [Daucus carota]
MSIFISSTSLPLCPTKPPPISAVKASFPIMGFPPTTHLLAGALSLGLVLSPPCISLESSAMSSSAAQLVESSAEACGDEESVKRDVVNAPELVSNDDVVEQAWEIVNESFLDPSGNRWSPRSWLQKKEDLAGTSIKTGTKAHDIIRRMLASLGDPYTRFLPPPEFSKMARYDMTGIGINLREVPDDNGGVKLKVLGLILDGPAHNAGVQQGDELLSVNGVDVRGKSAFEASSLIQGPSETVVNIMVKHGNCGPVKSLEVERQLVARTPVFYRLEQVEGAATSVGYVRLKEFNALARKDIVTAIQRLQDMGASYFILDLRDNHGGLVQAGIEIAKLFMNQGETVIYTAGRETQYQNNIIADSAPLFTSPVIVLVNKNTASASEIVASALHDNCRAVLVGEKTFGKGLIQSVFELQDGSGVVVTIGKYITPNHLDINGNGIEPDFKKFPGSSIVENSPSEAVWQNGQWISVNQSFEDSSEYTAQLDTIPIINPTTPTTTPAINPTPTTTTPTFNPMPPTVTTAPTTPTTTPTTANPASSGGSWCIANPSASETALQVALDYACGYGGADCSALQPGATCYNPNTLRDHASYAFNDYYQKNPVPTSCVFGGSAQLTYTDPSSGSCRFSTPKTTSSMSPPVIPSPIYPTPTSPSAPTGYDSMPSPPTFDNTDPTGFGGEPTESPNSADFTSLNTLLLFMMTYLVMSVIAVEF